jgi:hypothetical protein
MPYMRVLTSGDCIHAEVCKQVNSEEFSSKNIAYCQIFRDRKKYVEVVYGHWIKHPDDLFPADSTQECSVCHEHEYFTLINEKYCPNCGSRMI